MAERGSKVESGACFCGQEYCVFCIKTYRYRQRHYSALDPEVECLIEPGEVQVKRLQSKVKATQVKTTNDATERDSLVTERPKYLQPDFSSRREFLQYYHEITLDPTTAFKDLFVSQENKRVMNIGNNQNYMDHHDRFTFFWQVLSVDKLEGRRYFEVDWNGPWVYVAAAYETMERHGNSKDCGFGGNDQSWALHCREHSYTFWHNSESFAVPGPVGSRIGVYLDHAAGVLSFYSVRMEKDGAMNCLHRVQTIFTQPLLAGLWVAVGATAAFCKRT